MPSIDINDLGSIGVIKDVPAHMLPPEAWSLGENVRVIDDSIGRVGGYTQVFGLPIIEEDIVDPFLVALLHFEGADASTTFTDSSASPHTFTANAGAEIDTAQFVFGASSGRFNGLGANITGDGSSAFAFGTGDFNVDFQVRFNTVSGIPQIIYDSRPTATNGFYPTIYANGDKLTYLTNSSDRISGTTSLVANTQYHVALTRSGPSTRLFLDGVQEGSTYLDSNTYINGTSRPMIGADGTNGTAPFDGWIDELRVKKGEAIWTADFTPPTSAYTTLTTQQVGVTPEFLVAVTTPVTQLWVYTSLEKAVVTDGVVHTDITRQTLGLDVDYTASTGQSWNSTFIGGILILNNGSDIPQFWATPETTTKLADLTNWPSTLRARVVRSFGPYLIALNTTVSGTNQPHNMRWSHPADPGTVPSSWDITDPTKDAGSIDFPDVESGIILDGLPLQGRFYVYKENSVWRVRAVGGRFIFDQDAFLETIGLLCTRGVAVTGDGKRHIFMGQDDMWLHDGNNAVSVLDKRHKRALFNTMDVTNFSTSFFTIYPLRDEAWFCYPETGNSFPNRAMIVNYKSGRITEGDCNWRHSAAGVLQASDTELWSTITGSWESDTAAWSTAQRRRVVLVRTDASEFAAMDDGTTRDGVEFTGTLQRTGLGIIGRKRNGDWIEDFQQRKLVTRIWPKMSGGIVSIRVGSSQRPDGSVTWSPAQDFDPITQLYADFCVEGAAIALEFSGTTPFKIDGYKIDLELTGNF